MGVTSSTETTKDINMRLSDFDSFALLPEKENENKNVSSPAMFLPGNVCCSLNADVKIPWPFSPTRYAESVSHRLEFSASLAEPDRYMEARWRQVRGRYEG